MASNVTLTYYDEPFGARADTAANMTQNASFAHVDDILTLDNSVPGFATLEDDYWVLGKEMRFFPENPQEYPFGIFSNGLCGEDGTFAEPPVLTLELAQLYSSIAFSLDFDVPGNSWCSHLKIQWYNGNTLKEEADCEPDRPQWYVPKTVTGFNRVVVTFYKMSHGWRYLKVCCMMYGLKRIFTSKELIGGTDLAQEADEISDSLSPDTLAVTVRNTSDIEFMFQRRQLVYLRDGTDLMEIFHIDTSERTGENRYDIDLVGRIGLLDMASPHEGGMYTDISAGDLIAEIIGNTQLEIEVDADIAAKTLTGYLPRASKRENLHQVLFATGAMGIDARCQAYRITAAKRISPAAEFSPAGINMFQGGSVRTTPPVTAVELSSYTYTANDMRTELYRGVLSGETILRLDVPAHSYEITGGTILSSGANSVTISGAGGEVVLTACGYDTAEHLHVRQNPNVEGSDVENIMSYSQMTLVSESNAESVLNVLYAHNMRRQTVKAKILPGKVRPGDYIAIEPSFGGQKRGIVRSMRYAISAKIAADVEILADGSEDE